MLFICHSKIPIDPTKSDIIIAEPWLFGHNICSSPLASSINLHLLEVWIRCEIAPVFWQVSLKMRGMEGGNVLAASGVSLSLNNKIAPLMSTGNKNCSIPISSSAAEVIAALEAAPEPAGAQLEL